jgi:hypothetical protein
VTTFALEEIQRPLRLGELLTATVRIYSSRGWAFVPLGLIQAAALVVVDSLELSSGPLEFAVAVLIYALAFTVAFALIARLVAGDSVAGAASAVVRAAPLLAVLLLVVGVPFALGGTRLLLLVFSALWLGLTSFAIPAALLDPKGEGPGQQLTHALRRTTLLARVEYWHAVGIVAALIAIYVLLATALAIAIAGVADLDQTLALAAAQVPLSPFFFIGLSVLYFDQRARAVESARPARRQ